MGKQTQGDSLLAQVHFESNVMFMYVHCAVNCIEYAVV